MNNQRYSTKDLENFTQIKAHTIRIWEQRYGLFHPKRTETNIRYYSEEDLKKILNIKMLYNSGYKISKIANLSDEEIVLTAKNLIFNSDQNQDSKINKLTVHLMNFKGEQIKTLLKQEIHSSGMEKVYNTLIVPFLEKLGQLWQVNSIEIIHEHFFSNIFRELLIALIDRITTKPDPNKKSILFLHDKEEHEFSLLMYYYILKKKGYQCHYFGQKTPINELEYAFKTIQPQVVVTTFIAKLSNKNFSNVHSLLIDFAMNSRVIVSGNQLISGNHDLSDRILHVQNLEELNSLLL